jgi:hypothetical protein
MMNENVNPNIQAAPVPVRTYTKDYPSLAPLASNQVEEHNAERIRGGEEMLDDHIVAASTQHYFRQGYLQIHLATPEEVVAAKKRETAILLESVGTVPVGQENLIRIINENHQGLLREFQQGLLREFQQMEVRLEERQQGLLREFQQMEVRLEERLTRIINENHQGLLREFQQMEVRLEERLTRIENEVNGISASLTLASIQSSRNTNRTLAANENIAPVLNDQGASPPERWFPRLPEDIVAMDEANVDELLRFYGIAPGRRANLNRKKYLLCSKLDLKYLVDYFTN